MKSSRTAWWVYVIGLAPIAIFEKPLRSHLGNWLAFGAVIVYLLLLRFVGEVIERKTSESRSPSNDETN